MALVCFDPQRKCPDVGKLFHNHSSRYYSVTYLIIKCKTHFKTWCKGGKLNIENSTDHFCEDTRQNALAALTNLGHVTPF